MHIVSMGGVPRAGMSGWCDGVCLYGDHLDSRRQMNAALARATIVFVRPRCAHDRRKSSDHHAGMHDLVENSLQPEIRTATSPSPEYSSAGKSPLTTKKPSQLNHVFDDLTTSIRYPPMQRIPLAKHSSTLIPLSPLPLSQRSRRPR